MKVAIAGWGPQGQRRAKHLRKEDTLVGVYDPLVGAENIPGGRMSWGEAMEGAEAVIIATPPAEQYKLALAAVMEGKHVLLEKPGGMNVGELGMLKANSWGSVVRIGYTLRYHPAVAMLKERLFQVGTPKWARMIYSNQSCPTGWRKDALGLDLGTHLHDLKNWLGLTCGVDMFVADDEWGNHFEVTVNGDMGKLTVKGLGGFYGPETFTLHSQFCVDDEHYSSLVYPETVSQHAHDLEWQGFCWDVEGRSIHLATLEEGMRVLEDNAKQDWRCP
jgi:Oxidoreductase family, NAD-binding Rossmann fold